MKHKQAKCFTDTDCDNCYGCHLAVCSVCGCYEGSLTTSCPGEKICESLQKNIYNNCTLDFTTEKGWHKNPEHKSLWDRIAQFEEETT